MGIFLFRGSSRLPDNQNNLRFVFYSLYSFGIPAILTIAVICIDRFADGNVIRPGFGEETCWFNSCTNGIYFLYGYIFSFCQRTFLVIHLAKLFRPLLIVVTSNIGMYIYASTILKKLTVNVKNGSKSTNSNSSGNNNSSGVLIHRQFSRALSTVSDTAKKAKEVAVNLEK